MKMGIWLSLFITIAGAQALGAPADGESAVAALENEVGGRIGFVALDLTSGRTLEHRAHERFALCSTFKWLLAADVLSRAFGGAPDAPSLKSDVAFSGHDLVGYSPVTTAHVADSHLSVDALVEAAVADSDNTAANLLLPLAGGPSGLTDWLRRVGDSGTRIDRAEPEMNTNLPADPRDTTTPADAAADLRGMVVGDWLPGPARDRLREAMEHTRTGVRRLRAGLPKGWKIAHKTGTCGVRGAVNDVAVVWPSPEAPIVIVAYLSDSDASVEQLEAAEAKLAKIAVKAVGPK